MLVTVHMAGCSTPPKVADVDAQLTERLGWDYTIDLACSFTNIGGDGSVTVFARVEQGAESWERQQPLEVLDGERKSTVLTFPEPTFEWQRLKPLLPLVAGDFAGVATSILVQSGGQGEGGIRGSCQVIPER